MQDLRLIGVDEEGRHVLLAGSDDARFRVPIDAALRRAARWETSGAAGSAGSVTAGPREVQALIRAGASAADVAEQTGWSVEKVHRYEGPILAERAYVVELASGVRLRARGGQGSATAAPRLADRVTARLQARGVEADAAAWDAWRVGGERWTVGVTFPAGGRQRQATWTFDPADRALHPADDEARWLSEDDVTPQVEPVGEPGVYDVEAEGGLESAAGDAAAPEPGDRPAPSPAVDLVTDLRARTTVRGRRARSARRRHHSAPPEPPTGVEGVTTPATSGEPPSVPGQEPLPVAGLTPAEPAAADPLMPAPADPPSDTPEPIGIVTEPVTEPVIEPDDEANNGDDAVIEAASAPPPDQAPPPDATSSPDEASLPAETSPSATKRSGRTPVPKWDDIIFGGPRSEP